MRCFIERAVALAVFLLVTAPAVARDPAAFYEENCATCHTIGEGPQGGPDLKGVTTRRSRDWLIRFLLEPEAFARDPDVMKMIAAADGLTMASTDGLTRDMADAILRLIEQRSGQQAAPVEPQDERTFDASDVDRGRAVFDGRAVLSGGGPACITCHETAALSAAGGALGPDLTTVYTRLGGRRGLTAWLGGTPTPVMRAVYRPVPLRAEESSALVAFLAPVNTQAAGVPAARRHLVPAGVGGALGVLIVAGLIGARRFREVRRPLVARMRGGSR